MSQEEKSQFTVFFIFDSTPTLNAHLCLSPSQASLWGLFIWRQADMRNVLDYKCDQEHAKMQFIDHQCQLISAHLDGLLLNQLQIIPNLENHFYTELCQMGLSPHQKLESGNPWKAHLIQIWTQFPSFGEQLNFVSGLVLDSAVAALFVKSGFIQIWIWSEIWDFTNTPISLLLELMN